MAQLRSSQPPGNAGNMEFELPYPPSVNHYYRHVGPRVLISREGRRYRERVIAVVRSKSHITLTRDVSLTVELYPPDRRRRDVDNCLKLIFDTLQHAGVMVNDSQVKELHAYMREQVAGGLCYVEIKEKER